MFDFIRSHRRLMQFVLLLFILPSFVFLGLEGYTRMGSDANVVARVGGQPISRAEFEDAQREQMMRMQSMFGNQFDARAFDSPEMRSGILDGIIVRRVLALEADQNKLTVSDQALRETIASVPAFAGANGGFDIEQYRAALSNQRMTPAMFESSLRADLVLQQLSDAVQGSAITPVVLSNRFSELNDQERVIQELIVPAKQFERDLKITDEQVQAYYERNSEFFKVPAQLDVEYVVLDLDAVSKNIQVSEDDLKTYYQQNAGRFGDPEERRASHILFLADKSASEEQRAAVKRKAEGVLDQVRENPKDFAKLAQEFSEDPGSSKQGGDLEFFGRGMMDKPFEDAAFALSKGEVSSLVESVYGYHIIHVTDIKPAKLKSLESVRDEMEAEIRNQLASQRYAEASSQFGELVYEQSESLKPVADKLGLEIRTEKNVTRSPSAERRSTVLSNERFLSELFGDEAVRNKRNTDAVEVAPGTLAAGRVVEYRADSVRPLESVAAEIRQRVLAEEAVKLARKSGEEKLQLLEKGENLSGLSSSKTISRANPGVIHPAAALAVMKADTSKLPAYVGVDIPDVGYGVYRINEANKPANVDIARRASEREQVVNMVARQEMAAYIEALKAKHKVEIISTSSRSAAEVD